MEMTHPATPSVAVTFPHPSPSVLANGGTEVCILTFKASKGHSAISAKNSADADAARNMTVAFKPGISFSPYKYLKTS